MRVRIGHVVAVAASIAALIVASCGGGKVSGSDGGSGGSDGGAAQPTGSVTTPIWHRPASPAACPPQPPSDCPAGFSGSCAKAGDCTAGFNGACVLNGTQCACQYDACRTDADCGPGTDCECHSRGAAGSSGSPTVCVPSNCRVDADCASGYCSPTFGYCGGITGWFCHVSGDECGNGTDCAAPVNGNVPSCSYSPEVGHWTCSTVPFCSG